MPLTLPDNLQQPIAEDRSRYPAQPCRLVLPLTPQESRAAPGVAVEPQGRLTNRRGEALPPAASVPMSRCSAQQLRPAHWLHAAAGRVCLRDCVCCIYSIMGDLLSLDFSPGLGLLSFLQPQPQQQRHEHRRGSTAMPCRLLASTRLLFCLQWATHASELPCKGVGMVHKAGCIS